MSDKIKHTPGPWKAEQSTWPRISVKGVWWQIWAQGQRDADFVADVGRTDNATDEDVIRDAATAHLIAAAPDLLTALELGAAMRTAQARYFASRTQANLIASKQAESAFDKAATAALSKVQGDTL